jgi:hypothetical protein
MPTIRLCTTSDLAAIYAIVNDAAQAYRGVSEIPSSVMSPVIRASSTCTSGDDDAHVECRAHVLRKAA